MIINSIFAGISSFAFAVLFNVKGNKLIASGISGFVSWFMYLLLLNHDSSEFTALFIATASVTIYSEIMARKLKTPVTTFLIAGLIPMVPGKGMYNTMFEAIKGNSSAAALSFYNTVLGAGSIAIGIMFVSSVVRLIKTNRISKKNT